MCLSDAANNVKHSNQHGIFVLKIFYSEALSLITVREKIEKVKTKEV